MEQGKIDCKSFVQLIQLIADDEATAEQKREFKRHFDKCKHCADHYDIEESTIEFIKSKLCECKVNAPKGLINDIKQKIASVGN